MQSSCHLSNSPKPLIVSSAHALKCTPTDVVSCALQHYNILPGHGKPRAGQEWTVYAALVVSSSIPNTPPYVLCSATGSKCTTRGPEGWCLRDLHAEVLVKRGFQRILWKEIQSGDLTLLRNLTSDKQFSGGPSFALKPHIQLHLFISDPPCGDASIYELQNGDLNFTGAKLIATDPNHTLSCCDSTTTVIREKSQRLGQLRIKSGRSNLPSHLRSTSLSCSDKILKWNVLGLQGTLLPVQPIYLNSIVVSHDPHSKSIHAQQLALQRAVVDRRDQVIRELTTMELCTTQTDLLAGLQKHVLTISIAEQAFPSSKSQLTIQSRTSMSVTNDAVNENGKRTISIAAEDHEKQTKEKQFSSCGFCINWQLNDGVEVLVGSRGTKHGKKCSSDDDFAKQASRLCRRELHKLAGGTAKSYRDWKSSAGASTKMMKQSVLETQLLQAWIRSDRDFSL
jgi:hypothetical protein